MAASLIAVLFVQEQLLTFLPNFQFTFLLLILFSRFFGTKITSSIIILHVLLDSLVYGGIMITYFPFMIGGYLVIPLTLNTIFRGLRSSFSLAILAALYSFIYAWVFIIPAVLILEVPFWSYFIADIPFAIILAASSTLTTLFLYPPLEKFMQIYFEEASLSNN